MSFTALGISEHLVNSITNIGYLEPTQVQQQVIPCALQGKDLMVAAQTGTGKTASFALPLLEILLKTPVLLAPKQTQVLILTPTRELAAQVHENIKAYAHESGVSCLCVFGGTPIEKQIAALAGGVDILVACPGRLLDLLKQNALDLSLVKALVLDEVDKMLDMGFVPDVRKIMSHLPSKRQNLLFSATFVPEVTELAASFLQDPQIIEITPPNTIVQLIAQDVYHVLRASKRVLLLHLLNQQQWQQVLIFVRTKQGANRLAEFLRKHGVLVSAIHGDKSQNARTKALEDFKSGGICALVATDIAARGLDIEQLPYVVNYDLPQVAADYVHRIGRTGRAGCSGKAISLVCADEEKLLRNIEKFIGQEINVMETPDLVMPKPVVPAPKEAEKAKGSGIHRRNHMRSKPRKTSSPNLPNANNNGNFLPSAALERDEFFDDEIDNFGNRADYVSPYQAANPKTPKVAKPKAVRGAKVRKAPKARLQATHPNAPSNGNSKFLAKARKRGYRSLMTDDKAKDANVIYSKRAPKPTKTPIILHKTSRPLTAEQLATLQQHLKT